MARAKNGHVLTLLLERGEPTDCAKGLSGLEKLSEEWRHSGIIILRTHNPYDLE
jgi:hypothetical protein